VSFEPVAVRRQYPAVPSARKISRTKNHRSQTPTCQPNAVRFTASAGWLSAAPRADSTVVTMTLARRGQEQQALQPGPDRVRAG
jgi:hypothetical protein